MRINVVGTSNSVKIIFSKRLFNILSVPHIEMDGLFWGPNWYPSSYEDFCSKLRLALKGDSLILDGNYTRTIPVKRKRVTTIIWLDFSFPRILYQAIIRATKRIITREELWSGTGNRETLRALFSKNSIVFYAIISHRRVRKKYEALIKSDYYSNIQFIRLRSPKQFKLFLNRVKNNREFFYLKRRKFVKRT
ncbi:MAG: adenylate kinase [Promethearchaeota archaeon]